MRGLLSIAIVLMAGAGLLMARPGMQQPRAASPAVEGLPAAKSEKKIIDLKSDVMGPVAPGDSAVFLVGNFSAQHNGAVITCDSAVRYSDTRIEFFGNVLINKNTTYIYGDRAEYNGDLNEARVFSDLVKVIDGDATLYTYKFIFNTKENIGVFDGGGVMLNRDNLLESVRGYYYADARELICVDQVEMHNDEYELKGDSVVYNMDNDRAWFFENTNIWNTNGEYLYADRGSYEKSDTLYKVTRNGYVLTDKQEMWSDSIDYYRAEEHIVLRRNLQIDDTEHKVLAFGDYGEYWKTPGNAFLTRRPAIVSYDLSQGDSLFMRADSMYLYTLRRGEAVPGPAAPAADSLAASAMLNPVAPGTQNIASEHPDQTTATAPALPADSASLADAPVIAPDSLQRLATIDSLALQAADTLTVAERKDQLKELAIKAKAERKVAAAKAKTEKLREIAAARKEKTTAKLLAQKEREDARLSALKLKAEAKLKARQARAIRKGKPFIIDSTALQELDSLLDANAILRDSLLLGAADSLALDSLALTLPADSLDSLAMPGDSIYRFMKGFRDVRAYRSDFQMVCDSMTAISTDSTLHLYIKPVLWNQENQITSEVMDIFTANQQIIRAEFIGTPMMVSQIDTTHYNQVAGKEMTAYFRDNQIYRNDVNGNAQTLYYMQDGEPPQITMMGVIESANITFYIEDKQVVEMVWRTNPVFDFYPMDKIPPDQEFYFKGFKWEGARRPTQADVFDKSIRPSLRAEKSALSKPIFPIQQRIDAYKKELIASRRWSDRSELVDAETIDWMRSLGFEAGQPRKSTPKSTVAPAATTLPAATPALVVVPVHDSVPTPALVAPPAQDSLPAPAPVAIPTQNSVATPAPIASPTPTSTAPAPADSCATRLSTL